MKGLWDLSQESNRLKGLQGRLCMHTHKYRLDKIREDLSVLQPCNYNHVQVLTSSSGSESACVVNMVPREGHQIKDGHTLMQKIGCCVKMQRSFCGFPHYFV